MAFWSIFFTILFCTLNVMYYTGTADARRTINLSLPFKQGTYFVFQGGKGLPTNLFHYSLRTAVFAMDIIKLDDHGGRAKHIFSKNLDDYAIFNDTVYSPCAGIVMKAYDKDPDNIPPNRKRGPGNTNQVLLATDSTYVFMGHFRQGSVLVHTGDTVVSGQPLAREGNSGFSLEPHLHIQAQRRTYTSLPWYKEQPLFILFGGKEYLLFQSIEAR